MLFRSLFEILAYIKSHTHYQGKNNNFTYNSKKYWINIHNNYFLFNHQTNITKPIVPTMFNIITKGLYCSKVTWEKATKIWVKASFCFSINFILLLYHIFGDQIDPGTIRYRTSDVKIFNYDGATRFGPSTGAP